MKRIFTLIIALLYIKNAVAQFDVIIRNGKIIDGTGNSWYRADIAVKDGKIISIKKNIAGPAAKIIDATGLIVSPGFIDVHTHIEGDELATPTAVNFIYDGVTTVIAGNCGSSKVDMVIIYPGSTP